MWETLNIAIKLHCQFIRINRLGKAMIVLSGVGAWISGRSYTSED
jgi:hypothetical protein